MDNPKAGINDPTKLGTIFDPLSLIGQDAEKAVPNKAHSKGFLRTKRIGNYDYWYWCRTVRLPSGRRKQVIVKYFGRNVPREIRLMLKKERK